MSLSDLASLGSLASGVAVLISLIYLALQVRQTEKNQQSLMQQGSSGRACDMLLRHAEPQLASVYHKGLAGEALTEVELVQFCKIMRALLLSYQDTFLQHERRLLMDPMFQSVALVVRDNMRAPGARAMWRTIRNTYAPGFRAFIDDTVQGPAGGRAGEDLELWKAALAEVRVAATA